VRIALYFPSDEAQVETLIRQNFDVVNEKHLDKYDESQKRQYGWRFNGYRANHYRVRLGDKAGGEKRYANSILEIQVASVLMHAWSEVEHDLAYKSLNGALSQAEFRMLDGLNGLVLTGELLLTQLQSAIQTRIAHQGQSFANLYELGAFLQSSVAAASPADSTLDQDNEYLMGNLGFLLKVLKRLKLDSPTILGPLLADWKIDTLSPYPLALLLFDYLLRGLDAKQSSSDFSPFLTSDANKTISELVKKSSMKLRIKCQILNYAVSDYQVTQWMPPSMLNLHIRAQNSAWETGVFPAEFEVLRKAGLMDGDLENINDEAEEAMLNEQAEILWNWFKGNEEMKLRAALGTARSRDSDIISWAQSKHSINGASVAENLE
jgi:hypothetical protein